MNKNTLAQSETPTVSTNSVPIIKSEEIVYEIMHMEKNVAWVSSKGMAEVLDEVFMPYDLYLEEVEAVDIDGRINNRTVFEHWCASRVLSLDRKYAKDILNSIGVSQATTDADRAKIALTYHCVSLTDVFWVRMRGENVSFRELNLYDHTLSEAIVDLSLRGRQMTVTNHELSDLAPDLSTKGCFPKAWIRCKTGFKLLKDGGEETVKRELLASQICQCFDIPQVVYKEHEYDGQIVTESDIITSLDYSIVSKYSFDVYAVNHDLDPIKECIKIDYITYYGMNILDYLTGNTDRHPENWGFKVENKTNRIVSLYPLMDFNQCFFSYDNIDGAQCQTVKPRIMTQREAAIEAVKVIGLRQKKEMDMSKFEGMQQEAKMYTLRLAELKKNADG